MKDWFEAGLIAIFFFVGGCTFGARSVMHQAVQHGGAHYNPNTGNFEWNDAGTSSESAAKHSE